MVWKVFLSVPSSTTTLDLNFELKVAPALMLPSQLP